MNQEKKKRVLIFALIFITGFLFSIPVFLFSNFMMLSTSTPEFCASCHEHKVTVQTWKTSTHYKNENGVVATCKDCHLPPFEDSVSFYMAKAYHGAKDVTLHFIGPEYDREALKKHVTDHMDDSRCLRCHNNLMNLQDRGARLAHSALFHPKPHTTQPKCLDCHTNLVHNE